MTTLIDSVERRQVTIGSILQILVRFTSIGGGVIVAMLQVRSLNMQEFGVFSTALGLVTIAGSLSDLGLMTTAVRRIANDPGSQTSTLSSLLAARIFLSLVFFAFAFAVSYFLFPEPAERISVAIVLATIPLVSLTPFQSLPMAKVRMKQQNILLASQSTVWLIVVIVLASLNAGLVLFCLGFFLASIIQTFAIWYVSGRGVEINLKRGLKTCWSFLLEALPLGLGGLGVTAYYRLTGVIVYAFAGGYMAAQFSAAFRFLDVLQAIPAGLLAPLLPLLTSSLAFGQNQTFGKIWSIASRSLMACAFLAATGLAISAPQVVSIVYGDGYRGAVPILQVLSFAFVPMCLGWLLTPVLIATKHERKYSFATLATAAVSLPISVLMVKAQGALGVAYVTLITESLMAISLMVILKRYEGFGVKVVLLVKLAIISLLMLGSSILISFPLGDWSLLMLRSLIALLVGIAGISAFRVITLVDLGSVLSKRQIVRESKDD